MNRIYKVIWSKVRNSWVVVSEIARNHGKEHASRQNRTSGSAYALTLALSLALGLSMPGAVQAADPVDLGNGGTAAYDDNGNLTIGNQVKGEGEKKAGKNNTVVGTETDTLRQDSADTIKGQPMDEDNKQLVKGEGQANDLAISTEAEGSTAVGYQSRAEGERSTAIGNNAKITDKPVVYYADADGNKTTDKDSAAWYKDQDGKPTQVPQVFRDADGKTTTTPQYVHTYTVKDPTTGEETTKTEITSDASKADQKDGKPVYNYQKSDNLDKLYSVTLYQASNDSIAAGSSVSAQGSKAVAVGYSSSADNSAVAIGDTAVAKENTVAIGKGTTAVPDGSIALGMDSQADRSGGVTGWDPKTGTTSVKTGTAWQSGTGALSIGNGSASRQITNVAAGSEDSDAVNLAQLKEAMTHYYSVKTTEATDAAGNNNYLNDGATGNNDLAAGVSAVATGDNATAVGTNTYASGEDASAYGYRAAAMGKDSVSIGSGTSAQQEGSVAIGGHAQGYYAVQVGTGSTAQSAYSVAVGGHAKGDHSVEVGYGSTAQGSYSASVGGHAIGNYSIAIGSSKDNWGYINAASAAGDNSIAIGGHTNSANDIAIGAGSATSGGQAITVGGSATGHQSVSVGNSANATTNQATAIGWGSSATGSQSTAVGGHAGDTNSTAVGQGANANYAYATAVGNSSVASGDHSTALGYGTSSQGSNSTAIGGASAKGTNVTAIGKNSTVGGYWDSSVSDSTVIGGAHISGRLTSGTAIGPNASVTGSYGVALGQNASVAYRSTGVGTETKASNTGTAVGYGAQSSGYQSAAVGAGSMATGQNAVSLGGGGAWGNYSIALGSGAGTTAHAIALGQNSGAWGENAIAIGEGTNAWRANSIVLGKNSKSGADKNIEGYDPRTGVASVDDTSTWYSTDEAVSIGRAEERDEDGNITATAITRQLNNLAAGTLDTDAVNVAQLKAATQKINMHDYSVNSTDTETDTNYTNGGALAKNSLAAGVSASTTKDAENAVAIGYKAQADGYGATVIGQYGKATGRYALAFGGQQTDTTAEPANNVASGDNAVSFGERTTASGSNSTAFGQETKATEKRATAFGQRTQATQSNATAFGIDTLASGQNATAFGNLTQATKIGATAFGNKNQATGMYATAWGGGDKVVDNGNGTTTKIGTVASGTYATAFGERTLASGESATAFGSDSTASGKNSVAFGENSTAAAENSLAALGGTVDETAANAAAIGNGAQAKLADSVALGSGALANRSSGSKGYNVLTGDVTTETSAAWVSNASAFAVGNDTEGSLLTRQITGVAAGSLDTDAVNVAQLKAAGLSFTTNTKDASNTTDNYKGYKVVSRKLGDTIAIKASDEADNHSYSTANLTTRIAENGDISILMDEKPTFTSVTTSDVIFVGNPDLTDKDGKAAKADTNAAYGTKTLTDSQNITSAGNDIQATRLHYKDDQGHTYELATMDDGQIYAGDIKTDGTADSTGFARTLNQKTTINGGVTSKDALTDGNIGVVSNGTDTLTVKLAKDLKDLNSVTTGKTVQNDGGITITNDKTDETKNVVINGDKISFGGNQVNNMGSGSDGTDADKKPTYNTLTNGANIGDVKNIANSTVQPVIDTVNKGWELDVDGTKRKDVTPTSRVVNLAAGQNIELGGTGDTVTIATADDVRFNTVRVGGTKTGDTYSGGIVIGIQSGKNADGTESANSNDDYYITGLKNTNWDSKKIQSGRAATEDQLQAVADEIKNGTVKGDVYVSGGAVTYNGEGTDTQTKDGKGSVTLTRQNGTDVHIDGLHDYYITDGTVSDDGKTLELTRNDVDDQGNHQKITVDLGNVLKHDLHLVQNPAAGSAGKYTVDTKTGTVTLKVQNADGTDASDITIGGFEGLGKGLKFGANQKVAESGSNPVTNQLGSTINITGAGDKTLDKYSGKNLLTSVEQDADGNTTIHVLMDKNISADSVVVGQEGKAGKDGKDGYIGINGKDGADGITTTFIRTEKGQPGADGKNGKPGVDGQDITRIVYQNGTESKTVATLDDGLKFAGDDGQDDETKVIAKKLNERLDIVGKAQGDLTDANIGVTKDDNGKLYIQLAKHVNLDQDGTLQAGDAKIGHFSNTELTTNKGNHPVDGSYTIGLSNKDWSVTDPDYVSGRAATEDQLAKVSEAINNATTAAGKRTVVTVNDKSNPATAEPGANAYGEYDTQNGNLMIAAKKDSDGLMTYNIKLNDKLALGKDGTDGQEGTLGLTGKDGLPGTDGKQGYSTTIIKTEKGQKGEDGKTGKENLAGTDITRIVYTDKDGSNPQTVATLDDGLKFVGNDGQEVTRKLNEMLSIKGGITDADALKNASTKNLGVRQNATKDGLEIVMTDTPDFTKVTVGGDKKITIGGQDNSDTKNPANGNYITGLDNTKWDKDHVTENRAATEGQLKEAINDIKGSANGGFGLADEKGGTVKKDLGDTVTVKGDGKNIETTVKDGTLEVSLKKDVDLGKDGSIKAGETTIDKDGVKTNEVKVGDITITKDGINGGAKQITNIASGIDGKQYADAGDNNAASIGDVKQLAKNEAKASETKSGKNITVKDDHTVNLNDDITLGDDPNKQVAIHGSNGQMIIGSGDSALTLGQQENNVADGNPEKGNYLNGLDNRNWDGEHIQNGRAATEDQLKTVSDKVNSGRKFQGDDGQEVKVGLGETLNLKGGAKDVSSADNIGIVKGDDNTLNVRLAKDLTGLNSVTTGNTTINNSGLTVKTGDSNRTITVQDGNVSMGGNQIHNVAPGTAPTDAVNVSQLQQTGRAINQLGSSLDKLGSRVDRVGANSAALAALHPLDFDPDDKLDFAVGAGNYSGANAVALGAFYRPNEDVMFSIGGSTGGGENMVNVGATFKIGQHNHVSNSRVAMAKEIRDLKALVARQDGEMQQLKTLMNQMAGRTVMKVDKDALFPDIPENHWAYDYVMKLARAGIIEGYEDGQFKGDRMMTRYEFAALIYRAIMAGAASNPDLNQDGTLGKLVKEFDGELKYIRIDVIEKDKHGNPTIERVRTVEDSKKHHGK
ncbi:ESPR-type extended signal peptide-containing protein [uncultured Acidaminococcus sp.]|uniref:ESPR-type extended signal peptide-containing protein n=1 Tax=uncultured Acidaminococcus sp. TaxID=352152 RepID=UPI0026378F47|nr:ESPR-type extended signal peptide-containing protein [uncultured Acidaminococcus sp.]